MTLVRDAEFMSLLGLTTESDPEQVVKQLVKGVEPSQAISRETIPMLLIYEKPGKYSSNHLVFEGKTAIEVYAKSPIEAEQIANRIFNLLHDRELVGEGFRAPCCALVYGSPFATGIAGVRGYEVNYDANYIYTNGW